MVDLHPGDLLFMPPGQFYARCAGLLTYEEVGTFLRYDTIHLSEWSTGRKRKGTRVNLRRTYISFKTYHRPTVVLAFMMLDPASYVSQWRDSETPPLSSKRQEMDDTVDMVCGGEFESKDCIGFFQKSVKNRQESICILTPTIQ